MNNIQQRIAAFRQSMKEARIAACIIPGTDPHASEYIAEYWKERVWISGFNGSAGTVAITATKAGLWTDSRYFLQAADQLQNTNIQLMKQGIPETPEMISWIKDQLQKGDKVGVNAQMFSVNAYATMKSDFAKKGIELVSVDLLKDIWTDRPAFPSNKAFLFDIKYAGRSAAEKIAQLREEMKKTDTQVSILSALDDIAWLFNIRGNDVDYNPVVIAFAIIEEDKATLFIKPEKTTPELQLNLQKEGVQIADYQSVYESIKNITLDKTVWVDGAKLNQSVYEALPQEVKTYNAMSAVFKMKSIKNLVEVDGYRRAMVKDGVALTKFFIWLEKNIETGKLTEMLVDKQLYSFRNEQENFVGLSFGTIAGYAGHGAIVHYGATPHTDATLRPDGIFLLDSGGQYLDGTTDITRTISLGNPTERQKTDFTLVLKGHIGLATAIFPVGTRGSQLDVLARKAMWSSGINYLHGTGHGVGHFLNVHEGPQSIRMEENPITLQEGMFMSNEPGLYRTDEHGIRTENLVLIVPAIKTEYGQFLKFETLTLCFIDKNLINTNLMSGQEIDWVNNYHQTVFDAISPYLNQSEKEWLKEKCSKL